MGDITEPPIARVGVVRETLPGITLEDPYRWMETGGEEFHHWLDGQARHAREHLDALPHRAGLLTRIRELGSALTQYFGLATAADKIYALVRDLSWAAHLSQGEKGIRHRLRLVFVGPVLVGGLVFGSAQTSEASASVSQATRTPASLRARQR